MGFTLIPPAQQQCPSALLALSFLSLAPLSFPLLRAPSKAPNTRATNSSSPLHSSSPAMTTPLKALIQERLRAKIVRQEVDGDEMDELAAMGHEQTQQHHHRHHDHCITELQSPSQLQRTTGQAQRMRQQQQQPAQEASQYHTRESGHHHKRHKSSSPHNQQRRHQDRQETQEPRYSTNQKLIDYYTWEHHQKYDNYFPHDRSFGHGFHDERYKTLTYEADRSPLPSPWRGSSRGGNQFQDQDQEEEEQQESKFVESPRYVPPRQQHHGQQRAASADLHQRHRDARAHPLDAQNNSRKLEASSSSFASAKHESHQQQRSERPQPHDGYESVYSGTAKSNTQSQDRCQHSYPRGYFESQLYDDDVQDTKLDEEHPESHTEHQQQQQQQHDGQHHRHKHHSAGSLELESPRETLSRKRSFSTFDAPCDVDDASYHFQQQRRHHQYSHQEQPSFEYNTLHVDDMVTSPLAAASSLAPLVFAAVTSPRLETKRGFFEQQSRQRVQNLIAAASVSASAPAPLDMAVIETTRRRDDLDAMPALGNSIRRRSSSTLVRRLDAMLSPGCHRAATVRYSR